VVDWLLANRVDTLAQRLDTIGTSHVLSTSSGLVIVYAICETCGVQGHTYTECSNVPSNIERANALHSLNPPLHSNPYQNSHNFGWKSYPNHPYMNPATQP